VESKFASGPTRGDEVGEALNGRHLEGGLVRDLVQGAFPNLIDNSSSMKLVNLDRFSIAHGHAYVGSDLLFVCCTGSDERRIRRRSIPSHRRMSD
jgi:hypothetical protein